MDHPRRDECDTKTIENWAGWGGILESTPGSSFLIGINLSTTPSWRLTINKPWIALEWDHHMTVLKNRTVPEETLWHGLNRWSHWLCSFAHVAWPSLGFCCLPVTSRFSFPKECGQFQQKMIKHVFFPAVCRNFHGLLRRVGMLMSQEPLPFPT